MIIKVCGINEPKNADDIANTGADWLGINFYHDSSRYIGDTCFNSLDLPVVGVFVNPTLPFILEQVKRHSIELIQLHGDETNEFCLTVKESTQLPVIKALGIDTAMDLMLCEAYIDIDYLLFDKKSRFYGGSGSKFDWKLLSNYKGATPFLVAGGIGPDDADIINNFKHDCFLGIDINSKFETSPGIKDPSMVNNFIAQINNSTI